MGTWWVWQMDGLAFCSTILNLSWEQIVLIHLDFWCLIVQGFCPFLNVFSDFGGSIWFWSTLDRVFGFEPSLNSVFSFWSPYTPLSPIRMEKYDIHISFQFFFSGCQCHTNSENPCQSDRCPCVLAMRSCSEKCRCRLCPNHTQSKGLTRVKPCLCKGGCVDKPGQRGTKCPCYKKGFLCKNCGCKNCLNGNNKIKAGPKGRKVRTRLATTHIKQRTTKFLKQQRLPSLPEGSWTDQETTALICCRLMLEYMPVVENNQNLHWLYSLLANHEPCKREPLFLRKKSLLSVERKVIYLNKLNTLYEEWTCDAFSALSFIVCTWYRTLLLFEWGGQTTGRTASPFRLLQSLNKFCPYP